jgi:hypothetical protein
MSAPAPLTAEVRAHNGVPSLYVNGQPFDGTMFLRAQEPYPGRLSVSLADDLAMYKQQYDNGARLFLFHSTCASDFYRPEIETWIAPNRFDYGHLDRFMEFFKRECPEAFLLPKLNMFLPVWWETAHPDEIQQFHDGRTRADYSGGSTAHRDQVVSLASELWYRDMTKCLERYLDYAEEHFGDRLVGYVVCGGITHEWGLFGSFDFVDYSQPMQRYWREWVLRRYKGAPPYLLEIPSRELWLRSVGSFRNPAESQAAMDFQLCLSDITAARIIGFCETIKRKTANRKVTGTYYGYTLTAREGGLEFLGRFGCGGFQGGHLALRKVLDSPAVDIIKSPYSYSNRRLGTGDLQPHFPEKSVTLVGKMSWLEDDNRSWKGAAFQALDVGYYAEPENFLKQLRRAFAIRICGDSAMYLQDLLGHNYDDPRILAELARLQRLYEEHAALRSASLAEVLVVVDEAAIAALSLTSQLHLQNIYTQLPHWAHTGAPFHVVLADDAARMELAPYRLVSVCNSVVLTPELRRTVERCRGEGKSILFMPASGLIGPSGPDAAQVSALTGIEMEMLSEKPTTVRAIYEGGSYGHPRPVSHVLVPRDAEAETWSTLEGTTRPALAVKTRGALSTAFDAYAATAPMLSDLLAQLVARAGCHRYGERGEAIYRSARLLGVHVNEAGKRHIALPVGTKVRSAVLPPRAWGQRGSVLEMEMDQWETAVFVLEK